MPKVDLAKLKEQLKKQQEKTLRTVETQEESVEEREKELKKDLAKIKKKQKTITAKNEKQLERKHRDEDIVRQYVSYINNNDYPEIIKNNIIDLVTYGKDSRFRDDFTADWDAEAIDRGDYALYYFSKKAPEASRNFFSKLRNLDPSLRDLYMTAYVSQGENYNLFFNTYSSRPEIINMSIELENKKGKNKGTDLESAIIKKLTEYAEKKGIEIKEETVEVSDWDGKKDEDKRIITRRTTYRSILSQLSKKSDKQKKILKKVLKDFYNLAQHLNITKPEDMNIPQLLDSITRKKNYYANQLGTETIRTIDNMSEEKLTKEANKVDDSVDDNTPSVIKKILIFKEYAKAPPPEDLKSLKKRAKQYGITSKINPKENPDAYRADITLKIRREEENNEKTKRHLLKLDSDQDISPNELFETARNEYPNKTQEELDEYIEENLQSLFNIATEKRRLLEKIVGILNGTLSRTKSGKERYNKVRKTLEKLGKDYSDRDLVSLREEYQDLLLKEKYVNKLSELTKEDRIVLFSKSLKELQDTLQQMNVNLDALNKPRYREDLENEKCITAFRKFKWISKPVIKVLIAPYEKRTKQFKRFVHDETSYKIKGLSQDGSLLKFYPANKSFIQLVCRGDRFSQYGLEYRDEDEKVKFYVGYLMKLSPEDVKEYKKNGYKIRKSGDKYILLQNDVLFRKQRDVLRDEIRYKEQRLEKILSQKLQDNGMAIVVGSNYLSGVLSQVAPSQILYRKDSSFINNVVLLLAERGGINQTVETFFRGIANITVYAKYREAESFREHLKYGFYTPQNLVSLSHNEKLPELYRYKMMDTVEIEDLNKVNTYLVFEEQKTVNLLANLLEPSLFQSIKYEQSNIYINNNVCKNKGEQVTKDTVFYYNKETSDVYCFDKNRLIDRFNRHNFTNPYTGEEFPEDFISRYQIHVQISEHYRLRPYIELYKQFKAGNFLDDRGDQYPLDLILSVLGKEEVKNLPDDLILKDRSGNEVKDLKSLKVKKLQNLVELNEKSPNYLRLEFDAIIEPQPYKPERKQDYINERGDDWLFTEPHEREMVKQELKIPNIWNIVVDSVEKLRPGFLRENNDSGDKSENEDKSEMGFGCGSTTSSCSSRSSERENTESTENEESKESENSTISTNTESRDSTEKDMGSKTTESKSTESTEKRIEKPQESVEKCSECGEVITPGNGIKSTGFDTESHIYVFCCTDCMSRFKFPHMKKK